MSYEKLVRSILVVSLVVQLVAGPGIALSSTDFSTLPRQRGRTPQTSAAAGASADGFTGSATFRVPIKLPPATGDSRPELALRYSSHGRSDSWVGYGWSLGLSTIRRSLDDGVPAYDDVQDTFLLDGEKLIAEDSASPLPRVYHTRREAFALIVQESDGSWSVRRKDGTVLRYGVSAEARIENGSGQVFEWLLSEREDASGNAFAVSYDRRDPGTAYIDQIRYTLRRADDATLKSLGADSTRDRVVDFVLEARPDTPVNYAAGFPRKLAHRLDRVDIRVAGDAFRRYDIDYDTDPGTAVADPSPDSFRSLLTHVAVYGSDFDAASPQKPRRWAFGYRSNLEAETTGWALASSAEFNWAPSFSLVGAGNEDRGVRLSDVDGNGLPDLLFSQGVSSTEDPSAGTWSFASGSGVYLNDGTGFAATASPDHVFPTFSNGSQQVPVAFAWDLAGRLHSSGITPVDMDGDALTDLVVGQRVLDPNDGSIGLFGTPEWYRGGGSGSWFEGVAIPQSLLNDGNFSFGREGIVNAFISCGTQCVVNTEWGFTGATSEIADLTGNGLPEIIVRGSEFHEVWFGSLPPFGASFQDCSATRFNYVFENHGNFEYERIPVTDGTLPNVSCSSTFVRQSSDFQICDVTSNSCADKLVANRVTGRFYTGDAFSPATPYFWAQNLEQGTENVDVNGDGLTDFVKAFDDQLFDEQLSDLWLNDGKRGYVNRPAWVLPVGVFLYADVGFAGVTRDEGVRVADVNGDGRVDVLRAREGQAFGAWLNDGDANEASAPSPWRTSTAWVVPSGLPFVDPNGLDHGVRLLDIDGDGMMDIVRSKGGTNEVYLNRGEVPDLLTEVTTPTGAITAIEYASSTEFDNTGSDARPDLPQVLQVVKSITRSVPRESLTGLAPSSLTSTIEFEYAGGLFDSEDREFRGFRETVETHVEIARKKRTVY